MTSIEGDQLLLLDVRLSRSGDELLSLWWCLDDYNLGKAMCGEAVSASPALSRATPTPATAAIMS
jgi:hypothetical protein